MADREEKELRESGQPGGGVGRKDYVGGSGIWPPGTDHPSDLETRTPGQMGGGLGGEEGSRSETSPDPSGEG